MRGALDALASHAGNEGMHIFWWYQALKTIMATAIAHDPDTDADFTDLFLTLKMLLLQLRT